MSRIALLILMSMVLAGPRSVQARQQNDRADRADRADHKDVFALSTSLLYRTPLTFSETRYVPYGRRVPDASHGRRSARLSAGKQSGQAENGAGLAIYRKRPEIVPANNRLSLERNVQQTVYKYLTASGCDRQPSPNNQFHRVSDIRATDYRIALDTAKRRIWYRGFGRILSQGAGDTAVLDTAALNTAALDSAALGNIDAQSYGFSVGTEQRFNPFFMLGCGVGGNWTTTDRASSTEKNAALFVSIYGRLDFRRAFLYLETGYGNNDYTSGRSDGENEFTGKRNADQFHLRAECGTWWEVGFARFEPFLGIQYVTLYDPAYVESGGRSYAESDDRKTTLLLGLRYSWRHAGPLARMEPIMFAGLVHELETTDLFSVGTFTDAPNIYRIRDTEAQTDRFFVGGGLSASMRRRLDLYFRYTAEIASGYSAHTLIGGMNWNF